MSTKNHTWNMETKSEIPSTISIFEKDTSLKSQVKFFKLLKLLPWNYEPITFTENKVNKFKEQELAKRIVYSWILSL